MDPHIALRYEPPSDWATVRVIDSHTGGEPFRVVIDGLPQIIGHSVLERRAYAMREMDHFRKILMWEPRGHADMYGGIIGPPERHDSDLSVLFIHNEGFSTMCGHGIIALCKVVLDTGVVTLTDEEPTLRIDTPAGQVTATSIVDKGRVVSTRFRNVPSFAAGLDLRIGTPSFGTIQFDLAYGGAFYAYVDATRIGVSLDTSSELVAAGRELKGIIAESDLLTHPDSPDLGFLYGVIFTAPGTEPGIHSRNVCVFADGEIDRSPTGTGVSGRLALLEARGELELDVPVTVQSITGARFEGRYVAFAEVGERHGVIPEVAGSAYLTGRSEYWIDPADAIGAGFLIR